MSVKMLTVYFQPSEEYVGCVLIRKSIILNLHDDKQFKGNVSVKCVGHRVYLIFAAEFIHYRALPTPLLTGGRPVWHLKKGGIRQN